MLLKTKILVLVVTSVVSMALKGQPINDLRNRVHQIIASKNATVAVSIKGVESNDTLSVNGNMPMPMMSVFKLHIALAVLNQVDKSKLQLSQSFFVKKEDLHPGTWSPMREEYPDGNRYLTLDQLLRYTVSHSDNNGCDLLLNIIGGTKTVQRFINKQGIRPFTIKVNEQQMSTWENLYINTTSASATTALLEKFYKGNIMKQQTTNYLYQLMVETSRGLTWMKAGLPVGTELAHRTGISDVNSGHLRAALNDVGIIKLPNGQHFILSVYLKNIREERAATEKIIADITAAAWDYFNRNAK